MSKELSVLFIEDSADDAEILLLELNKGGIEPKWERVYTADSLKKALSKQEWDIIISDYAMPGFTGLDALNIVKQQELFTPFIIVSGTIGEETAVAAMKTGASDYIMKARLARLVPAIERELKEAENRKKSEEVLAKANKNLEMLGQTVSSMNECVSISDRKHKIIFINTAFEETYGYKKEEIMGKSSRILRVEKNSELMSEIRQKTKLGGWKGELLNKKKDGTIFPIELSITPLRDVNGKIIAQIGISTDITARLSAEQAGKQAEKKLKESERRLALTVDGAGLGLWDQDFSSGKVIRNERWAQMLGYELDEIEKSRSAWKELIHPDDLATLEKSIKEHKQGRSTIFSVEHRMRAKDGEWKWIHNWGRIVERDKNGRPLRALGVHLDITDRKRVEEALLDSEARYRKFFMEDLTGDYLSTREGKMIDCNPQFLKIFGFKSLKEAQDYDAYKFYKSNSDREEFIKRLEKNRNLVHQQKENYKVNGEKIIIHENVFGEFDDDGKLINIRGYIYDVTKRVKAEQEVVKLSTAIEQSPVSVIITDTKGNIEYVNPKFSKLSGFTFEEAIGKNPNILKSGVNPESQYKELWNTIKKGETWVGEFVNKKKNGELFWVSSHISPILDDKNNITHFIALNENITERKKFITDLMEREEKYRTLTQNLNVGVYRSTPGKNGKFIEVNPAFLKMFEFRSKKELKRFKVVDFYSNSLDRNSIEEKLVSEGFLINEEVELRKKDGTRFSASISATVAKDESRKVIHYDGIIEDNTERKKARDNIELHKKTLQTLSNELTETEEKTKRRLAILLHDKLGQSLVLAKFKTDELNKKTTDSEKKKIIDEITSFIEEAMNESRNITYELSPPVLYEMGLISAISLKLDDIEKENKIKTSLIDQSKSYELEEKGQIILFRTISELLQNIIKHSKADSVNISFRKLKNDYQITVADNGIGFDLEAMRAKAVSQKKFGLFSIMERIGFIGGEVIINTVPNKGTKVVINLPIKD